MVGENANMYEKDSYCTDTFHKLSKRRERQLSMLEYAQYREQLRKHEFETNSRLKGIRRRKLWHGLLWFIVILGRLVNHQKLHIIADRRIHTKKPVIYASTHIGYFDVFMLFEAIKSHCYLFLGDPETVYRTFEGWLADANGIICMNAYSKTDRKIAKETAIRLLQQNGSLLIYPEGAWNVTDNLPVMKLFGGTVEMALKTGAEIVPIAIEQYEKDFYVNIGRNIRYANTPPDTKKLTDELRDILATLKWEIWESFPQIERSSLSDDYGDIFVKNIMAECSDSYTMEMIEDERYYDRTVTSPKEAYAFIYHLIPCRENAFLIRDFLVR